jgi:hypothetical protein
MIGVDDRDRRVTGDRVTAETAAKKLADGGPSASAVGASVQSANAKRAGRGPMLDDLAPLLAPRSLANREQRKHARILEIIRRNFPNRLGMPEAQAAKSGDLLERPEERVGARRPLGFLSPKLVLA